MIDTPSHTLTQQCMPSTVMLVTHTQTPAATPFDGILLLMWVYISMGQRSCCHFFELAIRYSATSDVLNGLPYFGVAVRILAVFCRQSQAMPDHRNFHFINRCLKF